VFRLLRGEEEKSMWEMSWKNAKQFSLTYGNIIVLDEEYSICGWMAKYIFSATGKLGG
jgi:hypothetical protein